MYVFIEMATSRLQANDVSDKRDLSTRFIVTAVVVSCDAFIIVALSANTGIRRSLRKDVSACMKAIAKKSTA